MHNTNIADYIKVEAIELELKSKNKKRENMGMNAVFPTWKVGNSSGAGFVWVV